MIYNLNDVNVEDDSHPTIRKDGRRIRRTKKQTDFSCIGNNKDIEVYFKNIENIICEKIKKHKYIVGCVAWLTNKKILKELSKKNKQVLIIVQDEDFLRPDTYFDGNKEKFKKTILEYYNKIKRTDNYISLGDLGISVACCPSCGIRRCGFINKDKLPAFPRMHNKFIVLGNDRLITEDEGGYNGLVCEYTEVITGSFNYTENSTNSLENIICVKDKKIVHSYYAQFGEIALISVELDWKGDWNPDESGLRYGS